MYLATDYIHPYKCGATDVRSQCRIRLYLPTEDTDAAVVICSELANNPGTSVTKAAEIIAAAVIAHFRLPLPPVWIEHYPPETTDGKEETFYLVVFDHNDVRKIVRDRSWRKDIGPPARKPLDREAVEMVVGQHV